MRPELVAFSDDMPVRACVRNVTHYPYHWHNALEIIYVLQGQVKVIIGGEPHQLKENNIAVINVDEPHTLQANGDNKLLTVQLYPEFCTRVNPDFGDAIFYCCSTYHEAEAPEKYNQLKGQVARLIGLLNEKDGREHGSNVKNCAEEIISHLIDSFDYLRYGSGIKPFREKQVKRFRKIFRYIKTSPVQKHGLAELADIADLNEKYLCKVIRESFGLTLQELVYYSKCEQAAKLFLTTDKMIYEIASECGFTDPQYLINQFRESYRCTPSEFRRLHKDDKKPVAQYEEAPPSSAGKMKNFMDDCRSVKALNLRKENRDAV